MLAKAKRLCAAPVFSDQEKTRVAQLLNTVLLIFLASLLVYGLFVLVFPNRGLALAFVGTALALDVSAWILMRRGQVRVAGLLFTSVLWIFVSAVALVSGGVYGPAFFGYVVITIVAGLLLGGRAGFFFAGLSVLSGMGMVLAERSGALPPAILPSFPVSQWAALSVYVFIAAAVLNIATSSLKRVLELAQDNERALLESNRELHATRASLERQVSERTRGVQTAAEVSRIAGAVLDPDQLLPQVVNLIRERLRLYYVGLFLLDREGQLAVLRAGTGQAGQEMVDRGHSLQVGGDSMIGQCVARNQARVSHDVRAEAQHFDNPLLPDTRSEAALPLRSRGRVIGAMTVQSTESSGFVQEEMAVLQSIADQVAVAVDNARLFAEAQEALARSDRIVRRYVRESWDRFAQREENVTAYRYSARYVGPDQEAWMQPMEQAVQAQELTVIQDGAEGISLAVPLATSGEVIGVVGLRRSAGEPWNEEELALARTVGEQVAQAVERMRLLGETQRSAQRESILRRTAERIRSQGNLDALLRVAAAEMRRVVGATHVTVRLGTDGGRDSAAPEPQTDSRGLSPGR